MHAEAVAELGWPTSFVQADVMEANRVLHPNIGLTTFTLFAALSVLSGKAQAQEVSGGVSFRAISSALASDSVGLSHRRGIGASAFLETPAADRIAVRLEVAYAMGGARSGSTTIALDYLQIPLLMRLRLGDGSPHAVVFGGPYHGMKLTAQVRGALGSADLRNVRTSESGWIAGATVEVPVGGRHLELEGRYTRAITGVFEGVTDRNHAFSVGVGLFLF